MRDKPLSVCNKKLFGIINSALTFNTSLPVATEKLKAVSLKSVHIQQMSMYFCYVQSYMQKF